MKQLNKRFSRVEVAVMLVLAIIIVALVYYLAVYRPVSQGITSANAEKSAIQTQLDAASLKLQSLKKMDNELTSITESGNGLAKMESYNNSKNETNYLNECLADTVSYSVSFDEVTRDGDLIRRKASIQYTEKNYTRAMQVLSKLTNCPYRCLATDVAVSPESGQDSEDNILNGEVVVNVNLTFFETMVDGKADSGLPKDESVDQEAVDEATSEAEARGDEITSSSDTN